MNGERTKQSLAVFNSDQVNRSRLWCPASELMAAEERHQMARLGSGLPRGLPVNIQHDMHRPVGWSQVLGHFFDGAMVRVIGLMQEAETAHEKSQLASLLSRYWESHHNQEAQEYKEELIERIKPAVLDEHAKFLQIESFVVSSQNLAVELYPELFDETSKLVDKDGLTDYWELLKRLNKIQPGVFHDPKRDLLLFAHRFFRRSLSHQNKLNEYVLLSFDRTSTKHDVVTPRLRLDPNLIGHPATSHNLWSLNIGEALVSVTIFPRYPAEFPSTKRPSGLEYLRSRIDLSAVTSLGSTDGTLDLSTLSFGPSGDFPKSMHDSATALSKALLQDIDRLKLQKIALALRWQYGESLTTLSIRRTANLVVNTLDQLFLIVDATKTASEWIEPLSEFIKKTAPLTMANKDLRGVLHGRLSLQHSDEAQYRMVVPDYIMQELFSKAKSAG